jgi:hypothetical protein
MRRLSLAGCDRISRTRAEECKAVAQEFRRETLDPNHPAFRGALPGAK